MGEFVAFVESLTGAGLLILGAVALLALGFLAFDRKQKPRLRLIVSAKPGSRRVA